MGRKWHPVLSHQQKVAYTTKAAERNGYKQLNHHLTAIVYQVKQLAVTSGGENSRLACQSACTCLVPVEWEVPMEYFPRLCKMSAWLELVELQFQTPSRATDVLLISSGRQRDGFIRLKAMRTS